MYFLMGFTFSAVLRTILFLGQRASDKQGYTVWTCTHSMAHGMYCVVSRARILGETSGSSTPPPPKSTPKSHVKSHSVSPHGAESTAKRQPR